jgi:hypothetical protein
MDNIKKNLNDDWIYFGVFLDEQSKEKLRNLVRELGFYDWKLFCHHMTIAFNNGSNDAQSIYEEYKSRFGDEISLNVTHIGKSDNALAVKISYPYPCLNDIPHITLAVPQGGKPVNSNYIKEWFPLSNIIQVNGKIGAYFNHM